MNGYKKHQSSYSHYTDYTKIMLKYILRIVYKRRNRFEWENYNLFSIIFTIIFPVTYTIIKNTGFW